MRPAISAKALESTLLSGCGVPPPSSAVASSSPTGSAPQSRGSEEATRRSGTSAPSASQVGIGRQAEEKSSARAWSRGKTLFLPPCAPGPGATSPRARRPVIRHTTAVQAADGPCSRCWTGNVSGVPAAPWTAERSVHSSTRPRAPSGNMLAATPPPRHRHPSRESEGGGGAGRHFSPTRPRRR